MMTARALVVSVVLFAVSVALLVVLVLTEETTAVELLLGGLPGGVGAVAREGAPLTTRRPENDGRRQGVCGAERARARKP